MRARLLILLLVVIVAAALAFWLTDGEEASSRPGEAIVERVVDGDTIDVSIAGRAGWRP